MTTYTIFPIRLGRTEHDSSYVLADAVAGRKVPFIYGCFLLKNNQTGALTLVDTGPRHWTEVERYHLPWTGNLEKGPSLKDTLLALGAEPEQITQIILTHLHHDHCASLGLFPDDIPIYVQRKELSIALDPSPDERLAYTCLPYPGCPYWKSALAQFVQLDGDCILESGLRILFTPGHTAGSQSVLVDTEAGLYCCSGDMYFCQENITRSHPHGNCFSKDAWFSSHTKIMQTGAIPLGQHVPETFSVPYYG